MSRQRDFGMWKEISRKQAQDAWLAIQRGGVKELADYFGICLDKAKWLIDAHDLYHYIPEDEQVDTDFGMTEHEFWYFMRKLTRAIDENKWDRLRYKERSCDLPQSVLMESKRRREARGCVD